MKIYKYRHGSNQYRKVKKSYALEASMAFLLTFYIGMLFLKNVAFAVTPDQIYLETLEFGKYPALNVSVEASLFETPVAGTSAVPKGMKTQIYEYLVEKFGDHAGDAITMIRKCENSAFNPKAINKANRNGTWDVGIMMINVDPANTTEVELLQDYKYNIDRGFKKWQQGDGGKHKNSFYLWTCGNVVNQYTYVDRLTGDNYDY